MSYITEDPANSEREAAYRMGYAHGVAAAIAGLVDKLSEQEHEKIKQWVANVLTPWSWPDDPKVTYPPDFPSLDEKA